VKTKEHAEEVFKIIKRKAEGEKRILHSNKGQNTRINAINAFKNGEIRILISTDVSARGLDASLVSHVINFDLPTNYEDFVHRIGRTARAGNTGNAITLIDPADEWHLKKIEELIRIPLPLKELPEQVIAEETDFDEKQNYLKEIDRQKKIDDPTFKGAFHKKKRADSSKRNFEDKFQRTKERQKKTKRKR
jgi:ATP-dependent RNA helicase RhlE